MAGILTAAVASTFGANADPYFEYTTLLLPGNGTNGAQNNTFLDGSTNNFTITRNGNTTQGTFSPFSQTGWGNYFDGNGDYLSAGSNSAFAFGTGAYTVELWVYPSSISQQVYVVNDTTNGSVFYFETTSSAGFTIAPRSGSPIVTGGYSSLITNSWNHVVFVRGSTAANQTSIFVNGTRVANGTDSTNWTITGPCLIGGLTNNTYMLSGYLSNTRIVKGSAVYDPTQTTITVPTAPLTAISGTSLLTCQSNRFIDNSTNNFTITRNGDTRVVAFSPFNPTASWSAATNGGSGYFDGSGDYLSVAYNAAFSFSTGAYCIETWAYSTSTAIQQIFAGAMYCSINRSSTGTNVQGNIQWFYDGSNTIQVSSDAVKVNAWNHLVFCRNGSGNLAIFANGTRVGTTTTSASQELVSSGGNLDIGFFTGRPYLGYMSGFRVIKGSTPYDPTQTSITVPTAPLTAITNTSLLLNFTNAGIYDATAKNDLETVGNAQISNTTAKFGSTSMSFDGTGDYLNSPSMPMYSLGTGDFTIEFWAYWAGGSFSNYATALDTRNASLANGLGISTNITNGYWYVSIAGQEILSSTPPSATWQHIAVTRQGTSLKLFINGTQGGSTYTSSNNFSNTTVRVGARGDLVHGSWNGYLQDVRITNGYARYTANFTPPTAAFPTL